MTNHARRRFLVGAGALAGAALPVFAAPTAYNKPPTGTVGLLHVVYFWLKKPDSAADRAALIAGLQTLAEIPSVRSLQIGVPASTEQRAVVDNSFQVSELMMFDDVAGQNAYQEHPIHKQFVANCEHLWQRVVVYDSQVV